MHIASSCWDWDWAKKPFYKFYLLANILAFSSACSCSSSEAARPLWQRQLAAGRVQSGREVPGTKSKAEAQMEFDEKIKTKTKIKIKIWRAVSAPWLCARNWVGICDAVLCMCYIIANDCRSIPLLPVHHRAM
jgi:hypothetical protein